MKRPVHFEILAEDPGKLAGIYETVFGWEVADWGGGEQSYWVPTTGPRTIQELTMVSCIGLWIRP